MTCLCSQLAVYLDKGDVDTQPSIHQALWCQHQRVNKSLSNPFSLSVNWLANDNWSTKGHTALWKLKRITGLRLRWDTGFLNKWLMLRSEWEVRGAWTEWCLRPGRGRWLRLGSLRESVTTRLQSSRVRSHRVLMSSPYAGWCVILHFQISASKMGDRADLMWLQRCSVKYSFIKFLAEDSV